MNTKPIAQFIEKPVSGEWGVEPTNGHSIGVIRNANFTNEGVMDLSDIAFREIPERKIKQKALKHGDIIIEKSGGSPTQPVGRVIYYDRPDGEFMFSNFTAALRPRVGVDSRFLYYMLWATHLFRKTSAYQNKTTGIANLQLERYINEVEIPSPPLPTQRHIAAVLDKAQALVANDKRTLALYDQLAKSLFLEMFGDPVRNERGWEKKSMRDVVERISDGPFGSNLKSDHYADVGVRVIRLSNVGVGVFIDDDKAYVREDHFEKIKKYSCGPGDVMVATMGTPNIRACKFPDHLRVAIHKADNILVRPRKGVVVDDYMVGLFNSPSILSMAENDMHGQTRTRISMGQIAKWEVPVPPMAVQKRYQKAIAAQEKLKRETETSLRRSESLFGSLLQGACRGELGS